MKKSSLFLIVLGLLIAAVAFPQNYILATGGTSGTYYPFGGAIAKILNDNIKGMNITAQATGASKENLRLVGKGEAELAIVQNDAMDYAFKGIEGYEKITGFATMATLYPEVVQIVVSPDSKINSVKDMKGKRISVGAAGSGVEANAKQVLEAYGLTFKDLRTAARLSFNESANAYKDKQIDGFFVTAGVPNTAIQDITTLGAVKILSIDAAGARKIKAKYKFYTDFSIPKEAYKGMTAPAATVAVNATLIVKKDLPDDVVYQMTKALFEKKDMLGQAHAKGKELSLKLAVLGSPIPFHPGAAKYFKEQKVMK